MDVVASRQPSSSGRCQLDDVYASGGRLLESGIDRRQLAVTGQAGLRGRGIGAEQQVSRVATTLGVFAEHPDEVEDGWIGDAFGRHWPHAAGSDSHGCVEELCDQRVGCLLQACTLDVSKPREA
jgi:hypothetical protein